MRRTRFVLICCISLLIPLNTLARSQDVFIDSGFSLDADAMKSLSVLAGSKNLPARVYVALPKCQEGASYPAQFGETEANSNAYQRAEKDLSRYGPLRISDDRAGILHFNIGNADRYILDRVIRNISFTDQERFNPRMAIGVLESHPEFIQAIRSSDREIRNFLSMGFVSPSISSLPSMPSSVQNVTVGEILDRISMTFKGNILLYDCADEKTISIVFRE